MGYNRIIEICRNGEQSIYGNMQRFMEIRTIASDLKPKTVKSKLKTSKSKKK